MNHGKRKSRDLGGADLTARHPRLSRFARYFADEADGGGYAGDPAPSPEPMSQDPSATPAPAGVAEPHNYNPQTHMLVDRGAFKDWKGGYKEALGQAKTYRQMQDDGWDRAARELGLTGNQLMDLWNSPSDEWDAPAQAETPNEAPAPFSADEVARKVLETIEHREQAKQREQQQNMAQQDEQRARQDEASFAFRQLTDLGLAKPGDTDLSVTGRLAVNAFYQAVEAAKAEAVPDFWPQDRKAAAIAAPANAKELARAAQIWKEQWTDHQNLIVSQYATRQHQTPGATLGGGPSGRSPAMTTDQMNGAELRSYLTGHMADE